MRGHLTHACHKAHPISLFKGLASSVPRRPPRSRPGATSPRFRQKRTAHTKPTANHPTEAPPGASDSRSTTDGCGRYVAPTCRRWDRGTLKPKTDAFCGSGRPQSASGSQRPVQGGAPRSLRQISYTSPRSALYSLAERAARTWTIFHPAAVLMPEPAVHDCPLTASPATRGKRTRPP